MGASALTLFKAQNASPEMGNAASKLAAKTAAAGGGGGVNGGGKPCTNLFVPTTPICLHHLIMIYLPKHTKQQKAPTIRAALINKFFAIVFLMQSQKYYGVSIDSA